MRALNAIGTLRAYAVLATLAACGQSVDPGDAADAADAADASDAATMVDVRSINCSNTMCPAGSICVVEQCTDPDTCMICHPIPPGCPPTMGCPPGSDGGHCMCTACDALQCPGNCDKADFNPIRLVCR